MKLKKLQSNFIHSIFDRNLNKEFLEELSTDNKSVSLQIYRNNVISSLNNSIKNNFKILNQYLGDEQFNKLSMDCIYNNPSKSGNLEDYSKIFYQYIKKNSDNVIAKDLASLDYNNNLIYISNDCEVYKPEEFQAIPPDCLDKVILHVNPTIRIFKIHSPDSIKLWYKLSNEENSFKDDLVKRKTNYCVGYRVNNKIYFMPISKIERNFLLLCYKNILLIEIYNLITYNYPNFQLEKIIKKFILFKIINKFTIN
jgi:hypothetical protein